jgi:hypothetical protein
MQFLSEDAAFNRRFPFACEFDMQCGEQFRTMDERDDHERNGHVWEPSAPTSDEEE